MDLAVCAAWNVDWHANHEKGSVPVVQILTDVSLGYTDTVPCLERLESDRFALSMGDDDNEIRLIGSLDVLYAILDNCRAALDSLQFCTPTPHTSVSE